METTDQAKEHLFNAVMYMAMGDVENSKAAHAEYAALRAAELMNENKGEGEDE